VNMIRECVFLATYFGVYEGLRGQLLFTARSRHNSNNNNRNETVTMTPLSSSSSSSSWAIPVAGGLSGAVAWVISFPLDCIRAGVQGQDLWRIVPAASSSSSSTTSTSTTATTPSPLTARQVYAQLIATRGIAGLYAGVTPSLIRAFLVSGSRFSAYEMALWILRGGRDAI
jgi:hypothetical protein